MLTFDLHSDQSGQEQLLPPAYTVLREVMFSLCLSVLQGVLQVFGSRSLPSLWSQSGQGIPSPREEGGQGTPSAQRGPRLGNGEREHTSQVRVSPPPWRAHTTDRIHHGQYASCGHAGVLSCDFFANLI